MLHVAFIRPFAPHYALPSTLSPAQLGVMKLSFLLFLTLPLSAGVTFVNSGSGFFPFAGTTVLENFNSVPDGSYGTSAGLTSGGVNLVGQCAQTSSSSQWCGGDYQLSAFAGTITGPMALYAYPPYGSQNGDLIVTLPFAVHAAAFEFSIESSNPSGRLLLVLSTGDVSPTVISPTGQLGFMGFLSDVAVSSFVVRVLNPGFEFSRVTFDNLSYSADLSTPEPSCGFLLGATLAALAWRRRAQ